MSHMKFKETVKNVYVRDIYGGHFGFYVENICSTQYILVYFSNMTPRRLRNQIKKISELLQLVSVDPIIFHRLPVLQRDLNITVK